MLAETLDFSVLECASLQRHIASEFGLVMYLVCIDNSK